MRTSDSKEFRENYNKLVEDATYYKTAMHKFHCKICHLPKDLRLMIDKKILAGEQLRPLTFWLLEQYPEIFDDERNTTTSLRRHKEYLPLLLDDVLVKSIFKRARQIIDNKDLALMGEEEKAEIIANIEDELIKEYADMESHRLSILNVLFKETLPLFLTRLHQELVEGKSRDVKEITDASNTIMKITSMLSINENTLEEDNNKSFLEQENDNNSKEGTKDKILSLTNIIEERVKKAT